MIGHPPGARVERRLRVLYDDGETLYGARGLRVVVSLDRGASWRESGRVEVPVATALASRVRATQRLARAEIYKLHRAGEHLVALARGGVYTGTVSDGRLRLSLPATHGSRPISLAVGPAGEVVVGDYHANPERGPMRIHRSHDCRTWEVVHEFGPGEIRHVHGIYWDRYASCYWVLVGDDDPEPGIARCAADFSSVHFVRRGTQDVRAYSLIIRPQGLVFASDSENENNAVYAMDREGKELRRLQPIENSCFHSGTFGAWMCFATVCEPSRRNDMRVLHIWASRDGDRWHELARYRKDRLPFVFQYGNVFFPEGATQRLNDIIYSGSALQDADDRTVFIPLERLDDLD